MVSWSSQSFVNSWTQLVFPGLSMKQIAYPDSKQTMKRGEERTNEGREWEKNSSWEPSSWNWWLNCAVQVEYICCKWFDWFGTIKIKQAAEEKNTQKSRQFRSAQREKENLKKIYKNCKKGKSDCLAKKNKCLQFLVNSELRCELWTVCIKLKLNMIIYNFDTWLYMVIEYE